MRGRDQLPSGEARERSTSHHDARPCSHQPPGVTRHSSGERHMPSATQSASVSASGGAQPSLRGPVVRVAHRLGGVSDHADIMIRCGVTAGRHPRRHAPCQERLSGWTGRATKGVTETVIAPQLSVRRGRTSRRVLQGGLRGGRGLSCGRDRRQSGRGGRSLRGERNVLGRRRVTTARQLQPRVARGGHRAHAAHRR